MAAVSWGPMPSELTRRQGLRALLLACGTLVASIGAWAQSGMGTLVIDIPSGLLTEKHWLYVDGRIVGGPLGPLQNTAVKSIVAVNVQEGVEFWDHEGVAAKFQNRRLTYFRPTIYDQIFQQTKTQVPEGVHVIELLVRLPRSATAFPFSITKVDVDLDGGQTLPVQLGMDQNAVSAIPAALAEPYPSLRGRTYEKWLADLQEEFQSRVRSYASDAIAQEARMAVARLRPPPPANARIVLDLPASAGGKREFDPEQVAAIVSQLQRYVYRMDAANRQIASGAPAPVQSAFVTFEAEVKRHNDGIQRLTQIVKPRR